MHEKNCDDYFFWPWKRLAAKQDSPKSVDYFATESLQLRTLVLVAKPENEDNKSLSRLHARDWKRLFLDLVSKPEIKCQKSLVSSQCARLNRRNSYSRLKVEKVALVDLWFEWLGWSRLSELCFTQGKQVRHCSVSMFWVVRWSSKFWLVGALYLVVWLDGQCGQVSQVVGMLESSSQDDISNTG